MRKYPVYGGIAIAVVAAAILLYMFDPERSLLAPKCMVHYYTGYDCPGCGSQRMLHALLHGDIAAAWHYNAFLLLSLPVIVLYIYAAAMRTRLPRLYARLNSTAAAVIISTAIILWTILRNIEVA